MLKPKISVLTPTIRPGYLWATYQSLAKQTFKDFEWLVEIDLPSEDFLLPKALNKMLNRAQGEIIVMLQDCIHVEENFLQHVIDTYNGELVTFPVGKQSLENHDEVKWDWRKSSLRQQKEYLQSHEWEADLAVAPKVMFFDIGGYNEAFCKGWSWDNVEVGHRAVAAGYKIRVDNRVWGIAIDHDKIIEHPFRGKLKNNDWRARNTKVLCDAGDYKLDYLPIPSR